MFKKLRKLGGVGNFAANALSLLFSYPGFTVSAALAVLVGLWGAALHWLQQPFVYIPACVFVLSLWTYIGILTLISQRKPRSVRIAHEYAYSFIHEQFSAVLTKAPANDP